jgi:tight adherence protein B
MGLAPVLAVFAVVFAVVVGAYWMFVQRPEQQSHQELRRRLKGEIISDDAPAEALVEPESRWDRKRLEGLAARTGGGIRRRLAAVLEQADMDIPPERLLAVAAAIGGGLGLLMAVRSPLPLVTVPLGLAAGWLPIAYVRYRAQRRVAKFEEQFPEAIELMARALRAGHAMTTGLALVAEELPDPVGTEFRLVYDRQNFGMSMPDALHHFANRVPLLDARFFVTAVLTQRESGGNLAEILDNLAHVVRERFKILRQVRVHTAHGRFTGYVLLALPAALAVALMFINPEHMKLLFQEKMGQTMIMGAIVMQSVGYVWIRQIIKIEV